ncbi:MAG TPA: DUF4159 domain-containing protein [Fimbriimonadaceae bacterium]|nr:DUF4159 domain-containing protein [Fimbriimonadaceae bacterium]
MPVDELLSRPITGITPFNELPIDAEIWREAHEHHHSHRVLHAITTHRPGIVFGLEVVVSKKERTLVVAPGVGIDSEGRTLLLSEPVTFVLEEKGQTYITLSYEDNLDSRSAVTVGGGKKHYRLVEGRQVIATRELPKTPYLELARIDHSTAKAPIKDASNPFDPGEDELNLLYRSAAFPHCYADGFVGELCFLPKADPSAWKPNRAGLYNLLREGNGRGFHLDFSGLYNLRAAPTPKDPLLLYVAGEGEFQAPTDDQIEGLKKYLAGGGLLFGEASKGGDAFVKGFTDVAKKAGAKLEKVGKGHPLLTSQYVFSAPPSGGVDAGSILCDLDKGVVLSSYDYGGAWQGDLAKPDAADAREKIRHAVEFGLNIVALAYQRRRRLELSRLG